MTNVETPTLDTANGQSLIDRARAADATTWKNIEYIHQENGTAAEESELAAIYNEEFLAHYPETERLVHAVKIYYTRMLQGFLTAAEEYELLVLDRTAPKDITTKAGKKMRVANLYGIGAKTDGNSVPTFVTVSLFDQEADKVQQAQQGATYRTFFGGGLKDGVLSLTATQRTSFQSPVEGAGIDAKEVVERLFPHVAVSEIAGHVSKNPQDLKLVKATVIFANVRTSKKGSSFGSMKVYDGSLTPAEIQAGKGLSVMCSPEQIRFGAGTGVYILGNVRAGNEQYGPTLNATAILTDGPVIPMAAPMKTSAPAAAPGGSQAAENDDVVDFSNFQ